MDNQTEGARDLGFLLSEANGNRSRETVTIASGQGVLAAGTVLGQIDDSFGEYAASPNEAASATDGAETATCILAYGVDATDASVDAAVISRDAEVKGDELTYDSSVDDATKQAAKATQLASVGIIVR